MWMKWLGALCDAWEMRCLWVVPDVLWETRWLPRAWLRGQGVTPRIACRGVERNDRLSAGSARG